MVKKKRILIIDAPLGGGHKSISDSIVDALQKKSQNLEIIHEEIDVTRQQFLYQLSIKHFSRVYKAFYQASNVIATPSQITELEAVTAYKQTEEIVMKVKPDVMVSNLPATSLTVPKIVKKHGLKSKCVVFVADPFNPHRSFFNPQADHICVATTASYTIGRKFKIPSERLSITGHPIRAQFYDDSKSKQELRDKLRWSERLFTVLIGGSGEGGDKVEEILKQINEKDLKRIQVVCMTGRNEKLYGNLVSNKDRYNFPLFPYKFVENPADLLHASDVVLAKAGPNILFEAIAAAKPFVPTHHMEQEAGNPDYIKASGVGLLKNRSYSFADIVADIQSDETLQEQLRHNINRVRTEHKDAAEKIARVVLRM